MVSAEVVAKARRSMEIHRRYDNQPGNPRYYSPAQKRRMRKKYRKAGITVPDIFQGGK